MRNKRRFNSIPTATGGIARAAYARAVQSRLDVAPLLKNSGLSVGQIRNSRFRIAVKNQIKFLNVVAEALSDEFLGIRLAEGVDVRELGLLYYVLASCETLGDALRRVARYSTIHNEGLQITYRESKDIFIIFEYIDVARLTDRHQIEFFITILVRICRQITGRHLSPSAIRFMHRRAELPTRLKALFGCKVVFGSDSDALVYQQLSKDAPLVNADPYLSSLLVQYCEEALSNRRVRSAAWQLKVENAIAPLLPHGLAKMPEVAQKLGVSQRTLARRLTLEGLTFVEILDRLRFDLAETYLREQNLRICEVAWLLGYRDSSAFYHAFKRWTGKTPINVRSAGDGDFRARDFS